MNRFIFGILLLAIIGAMFVGITSLQNTNAETKKKVVNNCITDENGKCVTKQIYKSKNGDIEVENNFDISQTVGGVNGSNPTVDQLARDMINQLGNETQAQGAQIETLFETTENTDQRVTTLEDNQSDISQEITIINDRLGQQADTINTLIANNVTLFEMVEDAITDIENGNGTVIIPPIDNETNGGGNETNGNGGNGTIPDNGNGNGGNGTIPDNGGNGNGNETNGNTTIPDNGGNGDGNGGNATDSGGNVTDEDSGEGILPTTLTGFRLGNLVIS